MRPLDEIVERGMDLATSLAGIPISADPKQVVDRIAEKSSEVLSAPTRIIPPREFRGKTNGRLAEEDLQYMMIGNVNTKRVEALIPLQHQDYGNLGALVLDLGDFELGEENRIQGVMTYLGQHAGQLVALSKALQKETMKARFDKHTGLMNKGYFLEEVMPRIAQHAKDNPTEPISLLMFDLNRFKGINDRYGHPHGDSVLSEIGDIVNSNIYRTTDLASIYQRKSGSQKPKRDDTEVVRYGGEEFVLVLFGTDSKGAQIVAERIYGAIKDHTFSTEDANDKGTSTYYPYEPNHVTTSIGIATFPGKVINAESLLDRADDMLYQAKDIQRRKEKALENDGQSAYNALPLPILAL
jgi:GGDEF domain-containing protein